MRRLLEEAVKLEDVAQIERELLDRETTLEVLRGQLRTLRGQVDLATITLTIHQSPTVLPDTGILVGAWISDDPDDPCLGTEHFTAEPDSTLYFCLEVENTGASALTDVSVRSRNVRLDVDAFETLQGSFDRIEPGELLVAVLEVPMEAGRLAGRVATRGLEIGLEAEAVPVDAQGAELPEVFGDTYVWVDARTDDSLPGFADSVSDGAGFPALHRGRGPGRRRCAGAVPALRGRDHRLGLVASPPPRPHATRARAQARSPSARGRRSKTPAPAPAPEPEPAQAPPPAAEPEGSEDSS